MAVSIENTHVPSKNFDMEILIGTYEEFVLGFKLSINPEGVSRISTLSVLLYTFINAPEKMVGIEPRSQFYQSLTLRQCSSRGHDQKISGIRKH